MDLKMKMPDLATTDSAIKVIKWLVEPGQPIKRGQALLEVETDKATMEVECIATGIFKEGVAKVGDSLLAGQILAVIEIEGPARPAPAAAPAAPSEVPPGGTKEGPSVIPATSPPAPKSGGMFAKNRAAAGSPPSSPT
ncbi:MAG: biotin/lipoyl-containing protein [Opitutaceae bacterium]